ncbi:unnamed protein product [Angiostrongylus costaricensis]|uniref:Uncharacterized protein n=1 Tax=Angiostrongylus costaricensis TaxID=334426 RepID=A0A0R3PV61_ANGCS|nr:unnamed protein product [Angiostrongylus costaricensis]
MDRKWPTTIYSTVVDERHPFTSNSSSMIEHSLSTAVEERHLVPLNPFIMVAVPMALVMEQSGEQQRRRIHYHTLPQSRSRHCCAYKFGAPDGIHRHEIVERFGSRVPPSREATP